MRNATVVGAAAWLPEPIRENSDWPAEFVEKLRRRSSDQHESLLADLRADESSSAMREFVREEQEDIFLGARRRRIAPEEMTSHHAEYLAAEKLLSGLDVDRRAIRHVLSYSGVPEHVYQHSGSYVAAKLGLSDYRSYGVDTACSALIAQLDLGASLIRSGAAEYVLLLQSHLWSKIFPMPHPASPGIGDAATAVLLGPAGDHRGILACHARTQGEHFHSVVFKRSDDQPWWLPSGVPVQLSSNRPEDAKQLIYSTVSCAKRDIAAALDAARMPTSSVDYLCSTQPRHWIPRAIGKEFGWDEARCINTFFEYAHTGVCGPVLNLIEALRRPRGAGQAARNVVIYTQGAGFTSGAAVLSLD